MAEGIILSASPLWSLFPVGADHENFQYDRPNMTLTAIGIVFSGSQNWHSTKLQTKLKYIDIEHQTDSLLASLPRGHVGSCLGFQRQFATSGGSGATRRVYL